MAEREDPVVLPLNSPVCKHEQTVLTSFVYVKTKRRNKEQVVSGVSVFTLNKG